MFKRILALVITFTMLFTTTLSFAASSQTFSTALSDSDEKAIIQEVYASLSDEAKLIFNEQICKDETLYEVHSKYIGNSSLLKTNVNTDFAILQSSLMASSRNQNALDVLKVELSALALSPALYYALVGEGAALVAAGIDGPIPVGDVVGLVVAGLSTIVVAYNASEFIEKYDGISRAFSIAFTVAFIQIKQGLDQIYQKCVTAIYGTVSISGKTVTYAGSTYYCSTIASTLTQEQKNYSRYYPALLYGGNVYVDVFHGINTETATAIMGLNNTNFGVWATSSTYAREACGSSYRRDRAHNNGKEGYYPHYHMMPAPKDHSHCWFLY